MQQLARAGKARICGSGDLSLLLLGDGGLLQVVSDSVDVLAVGALGTVGLLLLKLLNLLLGGLNVLVAELAFVQFSDPFRSGYTYTLSLGSLVILPVVELGADLLDDAGNLVAAHGRLNAHKGAVLDDRGRAVEALGGSSSRSSRGTTLLALLSLLGS